MCFSVGILKYYRTFLVGAGAYKVNSTDMDTFKPYGVLIQKNTLTFSWDSVGSLLQQPDLGQGLAKAQASSLSLLKLLSPAT